MPVHPYLLTIGAHRVRTEYATVVHAATLLVGFEQAIRRLDRTKSRTPLIILLDLQAVEPGFPEFSATLLAAVLTHRMQVGEIQAAWLIGLLTGPSPDLNLEAQVAGCHIILQQPITDEQLQELLHLPQPPVPQSVPDRATYVYQVAAERVLGAVQAAQIILWTADDALVLLGYLTRYPAPEAPRQVTQRVLRALGGPQQAHQRLHAIVETWRTRIPLHAEILWQFLDGWERLLKPTYN